MAVANYHDTYGALPPAYIADADGRPMHSWRVLLLPFLEQRELYEEYDFAEPWDGPHNRRLLARRPPVYALHDGASQREPFTNYLAVVGAETAWPGAAARSYAEITDGVSNTILLVENVGAEVHWTEPRDLELDSMSLDIAGAPANGVSSRFIPPAVVTLDGQVQTLDADLSAAGLRALLTATGGEAPVQNGTSALRDGRLRPLRE